MVARNGTEDGARMLMRTLVESGVSTLFANPGTTELHMVEAAEATPGLRSVLALFEGVVSGAADGYGRIAGRPAATLLHLGPGQGNAWANFHNARRAHTPIVSVIGDHATYHKRFDPPLETDIPAVAPIVTPRRLRPAAIAPGIARPAAGAGRVKTGVLWVPGSCAARECAGTEAGLDRGTPRPA
jgi:acetolactate synthase-1/2/3 large subunit